MVSYSSGWLGLNMLLFAKTLIDIYYFDKIIKLKLIKKNEWPQQCFWIKRYSESSLDNEINISVINYSSTK